MIYLDSASTSIHKPPQVAAAMAAAISMLGNPGRGTHKQALDAAKCVYQCRKAVAALLNATPHQVAFTASATESLNMAINGLLSPTDHVITTVLEHNSVLRPLYNLQSCGQSADENMSILGILENGNLNYADFQSYLKPTTKAVVITAASNVTGLVVDMQFVSDFCKKHGLLLIVDAAQTAGLIPANMSNIHTLCFTGHKSLLGPQGIGGLCVRTTNISPTKFGGTGVDSFSKTQPQTLPEALETGTLNTPGIAGLLAGIEYINKTGMKNILSTSLNLAEQFYSEVSTIPNVKIYSNFNLPHVPIVALNIGGLDSAMVAFRLSNEYGISVRGGIHCAPLLHKALGTEKQGIVRFSFSSFNTENDVLAAVHAVREIELTSQKKQ